MKKSALVLLSTLLLSTSAMANDNSAKGLNVLLTSKDAQTQMMAMVLSTMTLKEKKEVKNVNLEPPKDRAIKKNSKVKKTKKQKQEKIEKL